jgi:ABC-type uncharacterized transport system substrate-binding protein
MEETLAGLRDGMADWPLREGRDYTLTVRSAQGDIAALNGIVDAMIGGGADVIIPLSTPSLQAVMRKATVPVVFSTVADPMAAGVGTSYEDHPANVTGITVLAPVDEMLDLLKTHFPAVRRVGTLFCPAEANSVVLKDLLVERGEARGFEVVTVAANSSAELADAAVALASRPIDAILQISDNLSSAGFTAISKAARQAQMPLFSLNSTTVPLGAPVAIGRDYHDAGIAAAGVLGRVLRGESPGDIPYAVAPTVVRKFDEENARAVGMTLPPGLVRELRGQEGERGD